MKIPTLLGLTILVGAISLGFFYYFLRVNSSKTTSISPPSNIVVVNISDKSASLIWETPNPSIGFVSWGTNDSLGEVAQDIRDRENPIPHLVHFVTLNNLKENTTYFYKVRSGPYFYPDKALNFKTAPTLSEDKINEAAKFNLPISGVIFDSNLKPIDEALVLLKIEGATHLATLATSGNFILPTVNLLDSNLSNSFLLKEKVITQLLVSRNSLSSKVFISLPTQQPLPKIILGQDSDFSKINVATSSAKTNQFDLNGDGKVNSVDLTILLQGLGKKRGDPQFNPALDFNSDGVVDQKDIDLLKKALRQ